MTEGEEKGKHVLSNPACWKSDWSKLLVSKLSKKDSSKISQLNLPVITHGDHSKFCMIFISVVPCCYRFATVKSGMVWESDAGWPAALVKLWAADGGARPVAVVGVCCLPCCTASRASPPLLQQRFKSSSCPAARPDSHPPPFILLRPSLILLPLLLVWVSSRIQSRRQSPSWRRLRWNTVCPTWASVSNGCWLVSVGKSGLYYPRLFPAYPSLHLLTLELPQPAPQLRCSTIHHQEGSSTLMTIDNHFSNSGLICRMSLISPIFPECFAMFTCKNHIRNQRSSWSGM